MDDSKEGEVQFNWRTTANTKQMVKDTLTEKNPVPVQFKIGDLVYIISNLSKSKAREQYIVMKCFTKQNDQWLVAENSKKAEEIKNTC